MAEPTRLRMVAALGLGQIVAWGGSFYLPAILAEAMARDLGVTPGGVFAAFSGGLAVAALLGPAAGRRIDRSGGRGALAASSLVIGAGLALLASAQGPVSLWAAWLLLGAGMAFGLYEAAFAALVAAFGGSARSAITGVTLIAGFASTLAWPLSAWMGEAWGWRGACLGWAALNLLLALPLHLSLPRGGGATRPSEPEAPSGPAPPGWAMATLAAVFAAGNFTAAAMAAHLPRLLEAAGAAPGAAVAAAALLGPAQVAARLMEFWLLRRASPFLGAVTACVAHPVGASLLLALGGPAAAGFTMLHGAGNGLMTIARGALPLALFGAAGYGRRQGVLAAPARLAAVAAPALFALLLERHGPGAVWLTAGLGIAGAAALGALALRR
jgi:predicted MFS family arabinose efflux permease